MSALRYHRIGLTIKSQLPSKDESLHGIIETLRKQDITLFLDTDRCGELPHDSRCHPLDLASSDIDLLIVIGGDGTIFRAVRELGQRDIPILGVNRGGIGFLAEIDLHETDTLLPALLAGDGDIEERSQLQVEAWRGEELLMTGRALNEAVIAQGAIARLIELSTRIHDEPLTTYRSDGLVIATPTGSTAYSLSAGGPIVHPRLSAMILTPLNAHSFSQKPIIIPGSSHIDVEVLQKKRTDEQTSVSLTLDGQEYHPLQRHDRVRVRLADRPVRFLRRSEDTFYRTLRKKLKWGEVL